MTGILTAVLVLSLLGAAFGLLLIGAGKIFEMPSNPIRDQVRSALPGANCGGCGYAGCDALADAIAAGKAPVSTCPVGGVAVAAQIAQIMGVDVAPQQQRMVATVVCQGSLDRCKTKFTYHGIQDCRAAALVNDGNRACKYACLGLGTCVRTCQFDAIHIDPHTGIAKVNPDRCQSCGACVKACPKQVLSLQPETLPVRLLCRAAEEGFLVSDNCKIGCVGCELCKAACKFGAVTIVNHLPVIDREKCTGCMMCAEACPNGALWGDFDNRMIAEINRDKCVGRTLCKRTCQFEAISGELKQIHEVNEACTGCGQCVQKCPKRAITLHVRSHVRDANAKVGTTTAQADVPMKGE